MTATDFASEAQAAPYQDAIREIFVHYTATEEGIDFSMRDVADWHKEKEWLTTGYHYLIRLDGRVEPGRPEDKQGAHVKGRNEGTLGIVYVGGLIRSGDDLIPGNTMTDRQEEALIDLLDDLQIRHPNATIKGHNDVAGTPCPGFNVTDWLDAIDEARPSQLPATSDVKRIVRVVAAIIRKGRKLFR